jgi:hypothetical protein
MQIYTIYSNNAMIFEYIFTIDIYMCNFTETEYIENKKVASIV